MFLPLLINLLMPFLFLDGLLSDMTLVLKIFTLMTIISYVTNHLGKGPLAILLIAVLSWFIIFDYFMFFGGIYVLYMLLALGVGSVVVDMFFVTPTAGGHGGGGEEEPPMSGIEFMEKRMAHPPTHHGRH